MTLDKFSFEPAGVFLIDAPDDIAEHIDAVSLMVKKKGGHWKFWRGSLSIFRGGENATAKLAREIGKEDALLSPILDWIVSVKTWAKHITEEELQKNSGLPYCIYELTKEWLGYATYGPGCERRLVVRQSQDSNTWRVVADPIGFLGKMLYEGRPLMDWLDSNLYELQEEGKTTWGIHKHLGRLDFTRAFTEMELADRIMEDRRYLKELTPFTNDPTVPSEAYFPLCGKGTGCIDAWLRFESQVPEKLRPHHRAALRGIIDAQNHSRQILWYQDSGHSGKSSVADAIQEVLAGISATLDEDALKSSFWFSGMYGARFINIPDVHNMDLISNPKIKRLTGGDWCRYEGKCKDPFDVKPNVRIMAHSNPCPHIDISSLAEITRIQFFPLQRNEDPEFVKDFVMKDENGNPLKYTSGFMKGQYKRIGNPKFIQDLKDQFWDYMAFCTPDYERLCPNQGDIPAPQEMLDLIAEKCASGGSLAYTEMLENLLDFGKDRRLSHAELRGVMSYCEIPDNSFVDIRKKLMEIRGVRDGGAKKVEGQRCTLGVGLKGEVSMVMGKIFFAPDIAKTAPKEDEI